MNKSIDINCEKKLTNLGPTDETISNFKSFYYLMNASPDQQIKIFDDDKIINLPDIIILNDKIQNKLCNHDIITNSISIGVMLSDNTIQEFKNWEEFKRTDWNIPSYTRNLFIEWNFHIKLPNYQLPQPHKIKIRIGSDIKPSEFFQIMAQEDNDAKIEEATAQVICKIDFVNSIICNELFQIVSSWYESLEKNYNKKIIIRKIEKYSKYIARTIHFITHIFFLLIYYYLVNKFIFKNLDFVFNLSKKSFILGFALFIGGLIVNKSGELFGGFFGSMIFSKADSINEEHTLNITKGDLNKMSSINRKNNRIATEVILQLVVSGLITIFSFISGLLKSFVF